MMLTENSSLVSIQILSMLRSYMCCHNILNIDMLLVAIWNCKWKSAID